MFRLLSPLTAERSKFLGKGVRGNDPFFKKGLPPVSSDSDPSRARATVSIGDIVGEELHELILSEDIFEEVDGLRDLGFVLG